MRKTIADEVLYVPVAELVAESVGDTFTKNEASTKTRSPRTKKARHFDDGPLALYAGHEGFLVRTALIRAADYEQKHAPKISGSSDVVRLVQHLKFADQEHMVVLCMNAQQNLLAIFEMAVGGTSAISIEKKHALKIPLLVSASGTIIVHNHPSGNPDFSAEDVSTTYEFKRAFDCIGIVLLDHIVVASKGYSSFFEKYGSLDEGKGMR